ncbi:MAG: sugar ABC transporter ATP-binding protein [Acetobacteraceae bacterium]
MAEATRAVLEARHFSKRFGGTLALDDVSLAITGGSVHGLLGHNGSGKSTLIKILAGFHAPEPGASLSINGRTIRLPLPPGEFRSLGMAFVHQDPGLIGSLSVVENLRIGALAAGRFAPIRWRAERDHVRRLLSEFGIDCNPAEPVESLRAWQRPLLAIVRAVDEMRALLRNAERGVLVLDEPTASLADANVEQLFAIIRQVRAEGYGVLFVSHDLDEVMTITDELSVLRDGCLVGSGPTAGFTKADLVRLIVGHALPPAPSAADEAPQHAPFAEVTGLSGAGVRRIDLTVGTGEIVGLTGLAGSGYAEVGRMLIGASPNCCGRLRLGAREFDLRRMTPRAAVAAGIVCVPGERLREGCIGELQAGENLALPVLGRFFRGFCLDRPALFAHAASLMHEFGARPADPELAFEALSGGNQQKVLLAKWLQLRPHLLLLEEPTQGVDVGAREQIFAIVRGFAASGGAVLCLSADHEQLAELAERVLIFRRGRIVETLAGRAVNKERIARACFDSQAA